MNLEELYAAIDAILKECDDKVRSLSTAYAKEHSSVKIGDTVTSVHGDVIVVDRISVSRGYSTGEPECVYHGVEMTKHRTTSIYQKAMASFVKAATE